MTEFSWGEELYGFFCHLTFCPVFKVRIVSWSDAGCSHCVGHKSILHGTCVLPIGAIVSFPLVSAFCPHLQTKGHILMDHFILSDEPFRWVFFLAYED